MVAVVLRPAAESKGGKIDVLTAPSLSGRCREGRLAVLWPRRDASFPRAAPQGLGSQI